MSFYTKSIVNKNGSVYDRKNDNQRVDTLMNTEETNREKEGHTDGAYDSDALPE